MRKQKAFTLTEVLVALVILIIALFSIAMVAISTTRNLASTLEREKAVFLAGQRLETLEGTTFDSIASGTQTQGPFTITWVVLDGTISKDVAVTVAWQGVNGPKTVTMSRRISLFAENQKFR